MTEDLEAEFMNAIQALNASVWRNRVDARTIEEWLKEFGTDCQPGSAGRLHALYLLSRFMYFGDEEVRALLRALYRDHFRYPIIAEIRSQSEHTRDATVLSSKFEAALAQTRFLAMGNPSESGTHLLYHYRQENGLSSKQFISTHEIFDLTAKEPVLADLTIKRYVFIDDFCGSGNQGLRYSKALLPRIADTAQLAGVAKPQIAYHVMVATTNGLRRLRQEAKFDVIACVLELDDSFQAFGETSRYFRNPPQGIQRDLARALAYDVGEQLSPGEALGYNDTQLMLGFVHNTPNNTLPIFWHPGHANRTWHPVFRRYYKLTTPVRAAAEE